jgi:hypothetical protein
VHDLFDILGVSPDARASDIRRACQRHTPLLHPDFDAGDDAVSMEARPAARLPTDDVAVDFVDLSTFIDRMQAAFFGPAR